MANQRIVRRFTAAAVFVTILCAGCRAENGAEGAPPAHTEQPVSASRTPVTQTQGEPSDSARVHAYVKELGYTLERIMDVRSRHYALTATHDGSAALMLIQVKDEAIQLLAEPEDMAGFGLFRPTSGRWEAFLSADVDLFIYSWDLGVEAIIGSTVYMKEDEVYVVTFRDVDDACLPAELKDINDDGTKELITYVDDLTIDYTSWACRDIWCVDSLALNFDLPPAWVGVLRWNGEAWQESPSEFRDLYQDLAERYSAAAQWVASRPAGTGCIRGDVGPLMRQWAARARALAGG